MQCETRILWHKDTSLQDLTTEDCIMIPGGFSYGDYLRCGAIARFSPIMEKVIEHANNGGYVFGICNGFQVLCESHLLPGALLMNDHQKFICQNQYLIPQTKLKGSDFLSILYIPTLYDSLTRKFCNDFCLSEITAYNFTTGEFIATSQQPFLAPSSLKMACYALLKPIVLAQHSMTLQG